MKLLMSFQQLVKTHLYFLFSTEQEPQPNVQRAEQVKIIPAPGEFWNTLMESSLHTYSVVLLPFSVLLNLSKDFDSAMMWLTV